MQFSLLIFSFTVLSLIPLLPMYFQPHYKCLKVQLDNTHKPDCSEPLENYQNGLQIHASECSQILETSSFLLKPACNFILDYSPSVWNYDYKLRTNFWQTFPFG